jgi:hypothetical protein
MRFKLDDSEIGKCLRFAIDVTKKTKHYYQQRNKYARTEKLIFDMFIGKLAEVAVWSMMIDEDKECTAPNFKVKNTGDNGDLKIVKENQIITLHIKCVRHDSPVTDSWLIQTNELQYLGENDYFAFCKYYDPDEIEVVTIIESANINWQKPQNTSLKSKSACYLNNLTKKS